MLPDPIPPFAALGEKAAVTALGPVEIRGKAGAVEVFAVNAG